MNKTHRLTALMTVVLASCTSIERAAELAPDERGAACVRMTGEAIYGTASRSATAAILEINTGDPDQVISPELIASVAESMGCR